MGRILLMIGMLMLLGAARVTANSTAGEASDLPYCFGAAARGCATGSEHQPALCRTIANGRVECMVHAGSIEHDTCCRANPEGRGCGRSDRAGACRYEWNKAQEHTARGLYWTRDFDPKHMHRGDSVDFNATCAPRNTVVAAGDSRHCCSRNALPIKEVDQYGGNRMRCQ